jgi:O-antigen/teichoic acid export membrane protein
MILALYQTNPSRPDIWEIYSIWPVTVIALLSLLIIAAYYLGLRSGRSKASPSAWTRVEVLTALGVAVMIATFIVTLLNAEVRKWLGLP